MFPMADYLDSEEEPATAETGPGKRLSGSAIIGRIPGSPWRGALSPKAS